MSQFIGTVAYLGGVWALPEVFAWAWGQLIQFNAEHLGPIHYTRATTSEHRLARNHLAKTMRGEWLVMLDTDHQFEPDLVARLLHRAESYGLEVLSGLYRYKTPPYAPVMYTCGSNRRVFDPIIQWETPIVNVDAVGAGVLLVRRKVFDRIRAELREEPFDHRPPLGEDMSFCERCRQLEIPIWVDTRIESRHLIPQTIGDEHFDADACYRVIESRRDGITG